MSVTNTNEPVDDDDKATTEDDLRAIKYPEDGVETSNEEDEPNEGDDDEKASEDGEEESNDDSEDGEDSNKEEEPKFVKKFSNIKGDTPEEYIANLEAAYDNSTAEFHKLRTAQQETKKDDDSEESATPDPVTLYSKQKMEEEIGEAFKEFSSKFTQVQDPEKYNKFIAEVKVLSQTIYESQKRLAPPAELYKKAAAVLDWEPQDVVTDKDRLDNAVKGTASNTKAPSGTGKKGTKSKVTDAMIATNKAMYPGKTDAQIREELEPYV